MFVGYAMTRISNFQLPPPANWQDFEDLCRDLWKEIWKDPNAQKNGRQGQSQHGVDIFGQPANGTKWEGVQCKGKDNYTDKALSEDEIVAEVAKAEAFVPNISSFTIATTGQRDTKVQQRARELTEERQLSGLFSVHVWSWPDILASLEEYPHLVQKHFPQLAPDTIALAEDLDELKGATHDILDQFAEVRAAVLSLPKTTMPPSPSYIDISAGLIPEYQAEIDHSRELLKSYRAKDADDYLEELRGRIWQGSPAPVRYRLLTNLGAAKGLLNKQEDSARLLVEALQYAPENDKALANAALGYLLLGANDRAVETARQALVLNPTNAIALSITLRASSWESPEEAAGSIPEPYRKFPEVANAIARLFAKHGNILEAKRWLEIAVENDTDDSPELKAELAVVSLKLIADDEASLNGMQLDDSKRRDALRSIELLTAAWNRVSDRSVRGVRIDWVVNRGLAKRLVGDIDGALDDINAGLEVAPGDTTFRKDLAVLLYEKGQHERAIDILKQVSSESPESLLVLAEVLARSDRLAEAIDSATRLQNRNAADGPKREARKLLVRLRAKMGDFSVASEILATILSEEPGNVSNLVVAAELARMSGDTERALTLLTQAALAVGPSTPLVHVVELADGFYDVGQFDRASATYESVVDSSVDTPLAFRLALSLYRGGSLGKALQICEGLYQRSGPTAPLSELLSAIYEEIGDLPKAREACDAFLNLQPTDTGMLLRLAVIDFRSDNMVAVDAFLDEGVNLKGLSMHRGLEYAWLLSERGRTKKAFSVSYELRRTFFNRPEAHLQYVGVFLRGDKADAEWLSVSTVESNVAVHIEDFTGRSEWYIVEDRPDPDPHKREFGLNHPLVVKLLGKVSGDEVTLVESPFSRVSGKVVEVKSKYVFAFQESIGSFEKLFPGQTGLWQTGLDKPGEPGAEPQPLGNFLEILGREQSRSLRVVEFYKRGILTIGAFAQLIGRDLFEVWSGLTSSPDPGLKCCVGSIDERNRAISVVSSGVKVVIDPIALMTAHNLQIVDLIESRFGKIGVAQSTADLIREVLSNRKGMQSKGYMVVSKQGEVFVRREITAKDVKRNQDYLEGVLRWISNACEILPCKAALDMPRSNRRRLEDIIGAPSVDSILLASEPGRLLYTDDRQLRSIARQEFGLEGIWTQVVLMAFKDAQVMPLARYNECVVDLCCLNYQHTSVDANALTAAAQRSHWARKAPLTPVLNALSHSDEMSAVIVSANFLYEMWKFRLLVEQREQTILAVLDAVTAGRKPSLIIPKLLKLVEARLRLVPSAFSEVASVTAKWQKVHIM